jgi:hydroxyacylglutathione hydrolase
MTPETPSPGPTPIPTPQIAAFTLGPYETNCFVVSVPPSDECWIVDAGFGPEPMIEYIRREVLRPRALILTHAHPDHIAGVAAVRAAFPDLPILIHPAEADWLNNPEKNLSAAMGVPITAPGPDGTLEEGQELELAGTRWTVLHTPGHSPGGVTLHFPGDPDAPGIARGGDALFAGSIGRTDFPGSDHDTLLGAIRAKLYALPDQTRVFPGHGPETTIGREKRSNPFVRG